jgi:molecular chaperone DnaK (HSP70)
MTEYIVGIDFGHGETAAWVIPMSEDDKKTKQEGIALKLRQSNELESQKIPSVVYFDSNGNHSLVPTGKYGIATGMKRLISKLSDENKLHYAKYIRLIIERILTLNGDILKIENNIPNFKLCIASPTKWNEEQKSDYLSFFNKAIAELNLHFEWIINESDAAYFTHDNKTVDDKCCLVIDYGSSTIDYTAMKNGRKISDDSWSNKQIGASCIERAMLGTLHISTGDSRDNMLNTTTSMLKTKGLSHIDPEQYLLFKLRQEKEIDYTEQTYAFEMMFKFTKVTSDADFSKPVYEFEGNLTNITNEYRKFVSADLQDLRQKLLQVNGGKDPDRIILSGGASIMRWFNEMVRDVFNCDDVIDDRNPSFVVARGIALYARAQEKALKRLKERIGAINFEDIYKDADIAATRNGIKQFSNKPLEKVSTSAPITGIEIRKIFCDFINDLNSNNVAYCSLVQKFLDEYINQRVNSELKAVIYDEFHVNITIDKPSIHIPIQVTNWNDTAFKVNGGWYDRFTELIDESSNRWNFTWEAKRDKSEATKIANGVISALENIDLKSFVIYPSQTLSYWGEDIKKQALSNAIDLFFRYQLFKTTFS